MVFAGEFDAFVSQHSLIQSAQRTACVHLAATYLTSEHIVFVSFFICSTFQDLQKTLATTLRLNAVDYRYFDWSCN